jgi:hypothetical protein
MNPNRPAFFTACFSALALSAALALPAAGDDDDDAAAPGGMPASGGAAKAQSPAPPPAGTLRLTPARQKTSGLVVEPLQPVSFQPETTAYGKVLDIQPLLELRVRYRAARADAEVTAAALELARKNRDRLSTLHRADIVAGRELVQAEAQWQTDRAKEEAARRLMGEIRREAQQAWGAELAHLALDGEAPLFDDFLNHRRLLLLVALPSGYALPNGNTPLFVARDSDRTRAVKAEPLSPAPRTDELVQGETWFYHTAGERLRSGMRVSVWAPLAGEKLDGVAIPLSAVVWQAGKPWVYRRIDAETFARTEIAAYRDYAGAWFVDRGFAPGEPIVVTGGQMLLSEEFRGQIPDEDDD